MIVYNIKMNAGVLELADEVDSKSIDSDIVRVQVPPPAPNNARDRKRSRALFRTDRTLEALNYKSYNSQQSLIFN